MKIFTLLFLFQLLYLFVNTENTFSQNFQKNPLSDSSKKISDSVNVNIVTFDSLDRKTVKNELFKNKTKIGKKGNLDTVFQKDVHPQDIKEEGGFSIESKDKKSVLKIYGSIRAFGSYDFDGLSGGTSFAISNIPVGDEVNNESTFFMTANISRFGFESRREFGFGNVFMKLETDFNGNNGTQFRIRHAFGQANFILAGQTWTVFSDVEALPNTVDLDGPPTGVTLRTVQLRYYKDFKDKFHIKASVESPKVTLSAPDSVTQEPVSQDFPDVALNLKKEFKSFYISSAGVFKSIKVEDISGSKNSLLGGGVLLSGSVKIFRTLTFNFQTLFGSGISSYMNISDNNAVDVILNVQTGQYELTKSYGGFIALSQKLFKGHLDLNAIYGQINYTKQDYFPGNAFQSGEYFAFNAFYLTKAKFKVGIEYTYGFKITMDNESGNANRAAFTFYYDF